MTDEPDDTYAMAHERALSAPLPVEKLGGVSEDPGAAAIALRLAHLQFEARAGEALMRRVREAGQSFAAGGSGELLDEDEVTE